MQLRLPTRQIASIALLNLLVPIPSSAQQPTPTLLDILQTLEKNLQAYQSTVPSFFSNEHLVSRVHQYPSEGSTIVSAPVDTNAYSIFRVVRTHNPSPEPPWTESRDVLRINGKPPRGQKITGPSILSGAFTGALSVVSLSQQPCMRYTLRAIHTDSHAPYVIDFVSVPAALRPAHCLLDGEASGHALIDPKSLQVTHIEIKMPHEGIFPQTPDGSYLSAMWGSWEIVIDYAPVQLDSMNYWMPSKIAAKTKIPATEWSFRTTYTGYHKLEVTSRIIH